jgi:DNA-binding response OmpR family regulator
VNMEKILVIEDDAAVQRALRRTFESAGFDVSIASDGATAMETFRATTPRLVILDLRLPGNSGQTCVAKSSTKVPTFRYSC